jgi:hypothetical protein
MVGAVDFRVLLRRCCISLPKRFKKGIAGTLFDSMELRNIATQGAVKPA